MTDEEVRDLRAQRVLMWLRGSLSDDVLEECMDEVRKED